MAEAQKPSVGRIVHYVSYGTPNGEYMQQCRAAVITEVADADEGVISLCVLNPSGMFFNQDIEHVENIEANFPIPGGTWHWPERT